MFNGAAAVDLEGGDDMTDDSLPRVRGNSFEEMKRVNQHGAEYWSARELQPMLGYSHWRSFENTIKKAITSCEQSGNDPQYHFARARKMIEVGKG